MAATRDLKVTFDMSDVTKLDAQLRRIEARVGRIKGTLIAKPGDTVVVLVPEMRRADSAMLKEQWAHHFPDVKLALICIPGASLG